MPITPSKLDPKKEEVLKRINERRIKNASSLIPDNRIAYNSGYLRPMPEDLGFK